MPRRVSISIKDQVAEVRLERADKRNALDLAMFSAIAAAQKTLQRDASIRVVIISGAGEDFCSGLDIKSMMNDRRSMLRLLWKWLPWRSNLAQRVSTGWRKLDIPVIAVIHGRCWGGGLQIALGADLRIAHPQASLSIMENKWGLVPDMGGSLALREIVGRDHAMRLTMTAELLDAPAALSVGLVTEIHPEPLQRALELGGRIAAHSPDAVAAIKRLYRKNWRGSEGAALARETLYQIGILRGRNQRIAVRRQMGEEVPFLPRGRK